MTDHDRLILQRINKYAEEKLFDIDPTKVKVSAQLTKLQPILQEIAIEEGLTIEDFLVKYLDLQSEAACLTDAKMKAEFQDDLSTDKEHPFLYR